MAAWMQSNKCKHTRGWSVTLRPWQKASFNKNYKANMIACKTPNSRRKARAQRRERKQTRAQQREETGPKKGRKEGQHRVNPERQGENLLGFNVCIADETEEKHNYEKRH